MPVGLGETDEFAGSNGNGTNNVLTEKNTVYYKTSASRNSQMEGSEYQEYVEDAFEIHETDEEYSESNCDSRVDLEQQQNKNNNNNSNYL